MEFVNLAQDNVVKTFTDFGLEWEIQFTVTILNEISSDYNNIMYISGTFSFEEYFVLTFDLDCSYYLLALQDNSQIKIKL